ncbi:MAG: hypothetical protein V9G04_14120 [Nocardioides sp.]|jgi:hypothetical protein
MGRRIGHSDERWAIMELEGTAEVRCVSPTQAGTQCKRVALQGSIVCDKHGGHLPNVQKRAKERYVNLADKARAVVESILDNPNSSDASKLKAAEMVNRATGMEDAKKVVVDVDTDPLMRLMGDLLKHPDALVESTPPPAIPAIEAAPVVEGEVVSTYEEPVLFDEYDLSHNVINMEPKIVNGSDTPPKHIREAMERRERRGT